MKKQKHTKSALNTIINGLLIAFVLLVSSSQILNSQTVTVTEKSGLFYFDAILFKSDTVGKSRFDVLKTKE